MSRNSVLLVLVVPALVLALLASLLTQTAHATKTAEDGSKVPDSFYDSSIRACDQFGVAYTDYNEQGHIILLTNERAAHGIAEKFRSDYDVVVEFTCDNSDVVDSNGEIIPVPLPA